MQLIIPPAEEWRDIPEYEGFYQVNKVGKVRSLDRIVKGPHGSSRSLKGKALVPTRNKNGYLKYDLYRDSKRKVMFVHWAVAFTFLGPRPKGSQIRHLNGNPLDNRLENLRYGTPSENMADCLSHGTHVEASKTHCKRGHAFRGPNLRVENYAKGAARRCVSCSWAYQYCRNRPNLNWEDVADEKYKSLMCAN